MTALLVSLLLTAAFFFCAEALPRHLREQAIAPVADDGRWWWRVAVNGALGLGIGGTALMLLGMAGLYSRALLMLLAVGAAAGLLALLLYRQRTATSPKESCPPTDRLLRFLPVPIICLLLWITLNPELEIDGLTYHFAMPKAWLLEGGIVALPWSVTSNWNFLSEMATLWGLAFLPEDPITGKLMELLRSILTAMGAAGLAGWLYGRRTGLLVLVLVLCWREVARYGTSDHTDVGRALFLITGTGLLSLYAVDASRKSSCLLGALLLGFAVGVKYTALPTAFAALSAALVMRLYRNGTAGVVRDVAATVGVFLLPILPWLAKNGLFTGNPFYPFLSAQFPSPPEFAIPLEHAKGYFGNEPAWSAFLRLRGHLYVIVSNVRVDGIYGALFLFPLGVLFWMKNRREHEDAIRHGVRIHLLMTMAIAMPLFVMMPIPRFMLEMYPLALLFAVGEGFHYLERQRRLQTASLLTALLPALFLYRFIVFVFWDNYGHRAIMTPPQMPTLTEASQRAFYKSHARGLAVFDRANEVATPNDRVAVSTKSMALPLLRARLLPTVPTTAPDLVTMLLESGMDPTAAHAHLSELGVTHLITDNEMGAESEAAFRRDYLELLLEDEGVALYRLR